MAHGLVATIALLSGLSGGDASTRGTGARSGGAGAPASAKADTTLAPAEAADLLRAVRVPGARAVVLNVWASWCVPCREEFPELLRFYRTFRKQGVRLILVSADFDESLPEARRFLREQGVDFPTYLKRGDDMRFIDALDPDWTGALPATFIYDGRGTLVDFRQGKTTLDALEKTVLPLLRAGRATNSTEVHS